MFRSALWALTACFVMASLAACTPRNVYRAGSAACGVSDDCAKAQADAEKQMKDQIDKGIGELKNKE